MTKPKKQGTVIMFTIAQVREFLLKHGEVYTVRNIGKKDGEYRAVARGWNETIGRVKLSRVKPVNGAGDLQGYHVKSGFETPEAWWAEIRRIYAKNPKILLTMFHAKLLPLEGGE